MFRSLLAHNYHVNHMQGLILHSHMPLTIMLLENFFNILQSLCKTHRHEKLPPTEKFTNFAMQDIKPERGGPLSNFTKFCQSACKVVQAPLHIETFKTLSC